MILRKAIYYVTAVVSLAAFDRIATNPGRPPWDTPLGGFVMIHGQPNEGTRQGDWTAGCVAVSDKEIERIYAMVKEGTPVYIFP